MSIPRRTAALGLVFALASGADTLSAQVAALASGGSVSAAASLFVQFGPTRPEHEPWRAWVTNTAPFARHLRWIASQIALPHDVPVVFASCGTANAFYHPQTRSIRICYEYLDQRRASVERNLVVRSDAKVADAVVRSALHIINHEVGHAIVDVLDLPVLGREEDAADGFSAFILLERGGPSDAYSVLQGALSNGQRTIFEVGDVADVHSLNDQRFYNLMCWMLGSDTLRFSGFAQQAKLPAFRQKSCPYEWAQLRASWTKALGAHLRQAPQAVVETPGSGAPLTLMSNQRIELPAGGYVRTEFRISQPTCRAQVSVIGVEGGNRDVVTLVFDKYNFLSWESGGFAEPAFQSGQMRQLSSDVPLRGPGDFVLVVSNKFSGLTPKVAQATLRVLCP